MDHWPVASDPSPPFERELSLLSEGELTVVGRVAESSNITLVVEAARGEDYHWGVYKPEAGERPLWDFPPGLHARERAAFLLSEHLGWHLVPPTIVRHDAPAGTGSIQWFVEHDATHYFTLHAESPETHDALRRLAVFDVLTNNTDRKAGHVLRDGAGHVWGIDHGLCFAAEPKLRTVIWDFAGEEIHETLLTAVEPLVTHIPDDVARLLEPEEVAALRRRAARLVRLPRLPRPTSDYQYPWPLI